MRWLNGFFQANGKPAIIAFFLICAFPVCALTALLTPLSQSPDEPAHIARAEGLLRGAILPVRKTDIDTNTHLPEEITGVKVDRGIFKASFGTVAEIDNRPIETATNLASLRQQPIDHSTEFVGIPNTATYFPAAYAPATFGLALGLATGASPYHCIILARLMMMLAFLTLGAYALKIAVYGEAAILTILLLPVTLFLAGTVNEDGILISLVCLGCAALTHSGSLASGMRWFGLGMLALFLGSKPPYLPVLAICLIPLFEPGFAGRIRELLIACVPVLIWIAIIAIFVIVPIGKPPYHPGVLYTGDHSVLMDHTDALGNLKILLAEPTRFITMPWQTNLVWGIQKLREMVGFLGVLQIALPDKYDVLWAFAGLTSLTGLLFTKRTAPIGPRTALVNFLFVCFVLVFTYWLIMISFYLNWTNLGEDFIDGMQGRYSLPLLPFLIFAIPAFGGKHETSPYMFAIPTILLGVFDIAYIPMKIALNYYLY